MGHYKGRFRAEGKKGDQGEGTVNGFLAGTEVKGAERKWCRQSQVIKLRI